MMTNRWIEYRDLQNIESGFTQLFVDYIHDFTRLRGYYSGDFRSSDSWKSLFKTIAGQTYDRARLVRILTEQNKEFHCGIQTLANIDLLDSENTFAVVTGQQIGIFGGPLYTLYKAISATKLAARLSKSFPEYNFVPVFWLECEDHDLAEVNHIHMMTPSSEIARVEYWPGGKPSEKNPGPMGRVTIDDHFNDFMAAFEQSLLRTEYTDDLLALLRSHYRPGVTLLKSFVGLLNHYLQDAGIIFLNPLHPELKAMGRRVFRQELDSPAETSKKVIQQSAELEENYFAQIKAKPINLYMFHKGGRYLLEPREKDFSLRGTRQYYTREELLSLMESTPEMFSPNVVLRPIYQDSLLPTAAYVAGPSEIAYFAQLRPVYESFGVRMPLIYPRSGVTLLEEKTKKVLDKHHIEITEIFGLLDPVLNRVAEQISEVKVQEVFRVLTSRIDESLHEARFGIEQIETTLSGAVDSARSKIDAALLVLREKSQRAQQQRQEISLRQIEKAAANIYPESTFQERLFNATAYSNKYGPDFVRWLIGELEIDHFAHQVIEI